jgi:protein O-GlcNAc transferase
VATVAEVFSLAWQHHQSGGFSQAEHLYRQILQADPSHADAWCFLGAACQSQGKMAEAEMGYRRAVQVLPRHASAHNCLGVLLAQHGQLAEAVASFRQAQRADPNNVEIQNNLGLALARIGQLAEAVECYAKALQQRPDYAVAHYNLGLALGALGRHEDAVAAFQQALRIVPNYPEALSDLGNAFSELNRYDEAVASYKKAVASRPQYAQAHFNLAIVLGKQEKRAEAIAHFREAIRHKPDYADAHFGLANTLRLGTQSSATPAEVEQAITSYHQALRLRPDWPEAYFNLAWTLDDQGKSAEAEPYYQQAVRLKPDWAEGHHNLGLVRKKQGKLNQAVAEYHEALRLKPDFAEGYYTLGNALQDMGNLEEAKEAFQQAIHFKPEFAMAHNNLGGIFLQQGLPEKALVSFREALKLQPDLPEVQSNLLFCLNYDPDADPDAVFAEYRKWGQHQVPAVPQPPHTNDADPDRVLRIGYVSPDLRQHALVRYFEPVLAHHDPRRVQAICYAEVAKPDAVTARLQKLAHGWHSTCRMTDAKIAQQIRDDRIDILVDLAGHTGNHRLGVFALKPAPVQVTWLGYLNTTGLASVDYRLTDDVLDPPGQPVRDTEELYRLPGGMCCFARLVDAPEVTPLPALRRGYLTFGSLHSLFKFNSKVFDLWSEVLRALPNSRLVMYRDTLTPTARENIRQQFSQRGVAKDRLDLRHGACTAGYLGVYSDVDVSLDVFPCTGGVTTCESLWMGVPVLSLCGVRPVARNTAGHLSRVGLSDWIVDSPEAYVALAVGLQNELDRLAKLRAGLRERVVKNLCDAEGFTRTLEDAFRTMWRRWCAQKKGTVPV